MSDQIKRECTIKQISTLEDDIVNIALLELAYPEASNKNLHLIGALAQRKGANLNLPFDSEETIGKRLELIFKGIQCGETQGNLMALINYYLLEISKLELSLIEKGEQIL